MANFNAQFKDQGVVDDLVALYKDVGDSITAQLEEASGAALYRRKQLIASINAELKQLGVDTGKWVDINVPAQYKIGMQQALAQLKELEFLPIPVDSLFTQINRDAVASLVGSTTASFADALTTVGRSVSNIKNDIFQQEVKTRLAEGTITGESRKSIAAAIKQKIADQGITALKDKSGASWSLDRYAQMLARTQLAESRNTGLTNKMLENGNDLVQVSDNGSDHPACAEWEGEILSISGASDYPTIDDAEADGLFHPNAVLSGTTFTPYGELNEMIGADYEGPAIRICTSGDHELTIGPNHPILTQRGLIKARDLLESDYLVYDSRVIIPESGGDSNLQYMPLVEDAFQTILFAQGSVAKVATAGHDFHGDRGFCNGEIKVVEPEGGLLPILNSGGIEQFRDSGFVTADMQPIVLPSKGSGGLSLETINLATASSMGGSLVGFEFVHIHSIHNIRFSGKAFDATTVSSLYNSNGFVVSNCMHTLNAIEPDLAEQTYGYDPETGDYSQGVIDNTDN